MKVKNKHIFLLILAGAMTMSFAAGGKNYFEVKKNIEILYNLFKELSIGYVDDLNMDRLTLAGLDSMTNSLDPYTVYYPEEDQEGYFMQTTGKYGGIGALISTDNGFVIISEPYQDSPAAKAGLKAGDKIIKIDTKNMKGMKSDEVSRLLKGLPGTEVTITVERYGQKEPITKKVTREEIKLPSVPYFGMLDGKIGYILLGNFTDNCHSEVRNALQDLLKQNATSIMLDLRNNPGGLLQEAVDIAGLFLDKNSTVVSTKGGGEEIGMIYKTKEPPVDKNIPLTILVNRGSASASEIIAGVMQDYDRAVILGEKSFGKGLVQSTRDLGYNSMLKLTTSKYYLPSGRCIQAIDYSGKYKDGADKIPDSLRTAYKTTNGRKVFDAGGIDPDMESVPEELSYIAGSLIAKKHIFYFASEYVAKHPNIAAPQNFSLTDAEFDDFINFVQGKDYDYMTLSEKNLEEIMANAQEEKYLDTISLELNELKKIILHDKQTDLAKYKNDIRYLLEEEIVSRYYFQQGRILSSLRSDPAILKAKEVLNNPSQYQKILKKL